MGERNAQIDISGKHSGRREEQKGREGNAENMSRDPERIHCGIGERRREQPARARGAGIPENQDVQSTHKFPERKTQFLAKEQNSGRVSLLIAHVTCLEKMQALVSASPEPRHLRHFRL